MPIGKYPHFAKPILSICDKSIPFKVFQRSLTGKSDTDHHKIRSKDAFLLSFFLLPNTQTVSTLVIRCGRLSLRDIVMS